MDAAELIHDRRATAGLTQHQLAVRAGTTKTAISRLERGHLSPSVATLERVLLSMGYRLELRAVPLETSADAAQLEAVAALEPTQRLDHGLASRSSLEGLLGAAVAR